MAASSGNSSGSSQILRNSGSEESLVLINGKEELMDQRKRKRMQSNRESARRSRMRKQKHLDDLTAQIVQLKGENVHISTTINLTTQQFLNVDAENSVLKAQLSELSQRLDSLNEILSYMNTISNNDDDDNNDNMLFGLDQHFVIENEPESFVNNPWSMMYNIQQPIMASADVFQY